jgi:LytS/YehU family sensor histidine kinase
VRYDISPSAIGTLVPGMLLQPLVENSIRHAISTRRAGGSVVIRAIRESNDLLLEVEDFGGPSATAPVNEGVGLRNTRERLERMYPNGHRFELSPGSEGLRVHVRLPYHEDGGHAG